MLLLNPSPQREQKRGWSQLAETIPCARLSLTSLVAITGPRSIRAGRCAIALPTPGTVVKALVQDDAERSRYAEAAARGDADIAVVFAGEGIDLVHAIEPAATILAHVTHEAEAATARIASIHR